LSRKNNFPFLYNKYSCFSSPVDNVENFFLFLLTGILSLKRIVFFRAIKGLMGESYKAEKFFFLSVYKKE